MIQEGSNKGVLKEYMIFQKTHTTSLSDVRILNMWGYELEDVSIIEYMPNVETLSLSLNKINTLKPFSNCLNLKDLFLRQNNICNLSEIDFLARLPNLRNLMLSENPIASLPNYRSYTIRMLPQLEMLDDRNTSEKDGPAPIKVEEPLQTRKLLQNPKVIHEESRANRRPADDFAQNPKVPKKNSQGSSSDDSMLAAVLALIPELSSDSLQIVLEAIRNQIE